MNTFLEALRVQRWDDHRYYHHSTINQSLHLVSALSFLAGYVLLFTDPAIAALVGWLVAMTSRQIGHFFFEPKTYDVVNQATHAHKEAIKVGYNLHRKVVLMSVWAASPALFWLDPSLFGWMQPHTSGIELLRNIGLLWLVIGAAGLAFRTIQLALTQSVMTGIVWVAKILTDPFHDIKLYWKAPLYVLRRQFVIH